MNYTELDKAICMLGLVGVTIARKDKRDVLEDVNRVWADITDEGIILEIKAERDLDSTFAYKHRRGSFDLHYMDKNIACIRKGKEGLPFMLNEFESSPTSNREYEFNKYKRLYLPAQQLSIPPRCRSGLGVMQ